jgi:hypothetical protein
MELRIRNNYHKWPREMITAIGMTEPNCGGDLKALLTTAEDKVIIMYKRTKNIYH